MPGRRGEVEGSPFLSHMVCAAPKGVIFGPLGLKTGIDFAHFGLESDMVFEGTTGAHERIYRFNFK